MKPTQWLLVHAEALQAHLGKTLPQIPLPPDAGNGAAAVSRRGFLKGAAAGSVALLVGFRHDGALAAETEATAAAAEAASAGPVAGNFTPFVRIDADGKVTAIIKHFEMGQGTSTGLSTLIAEELGVGLDAIAFEYAPANTALYQNLLMGMQGTGGSTAMANSFMQYRQAGAAARAMILQAAAAEWGLETASLTLEDGNVQGGGREAPMGTFVAAAAALAPPAEPTLKEAAEFRLIGNPDTHRVDNFNKVNGQGLFAMDVQLDNQLVAVIKRPPNFGATVTRFDATAASEVKGFVDARALPNGAGVVVLAENTWAAFKAREAVTAEWNLDQAETRSTDAMRAELARLLDAGSEFNVTPAVSAEAAAAAIEKAEQVVEGEFFLPFLAHAPMEPLNCTVEPLADGGVMVHDGSQIPTLVQGAVAQVLQIAPEKVQVNTLYAGGSFGRRATPVVDYHVEAAMAFALSGGKRPVKLLWSREDDIQGGFYRPIALHRVRVGLDADGRIVGWEHRLATQSIMKGTAFESFGVTDGVDASSVEGIAGDTPYRIPAMHVGLSDFISPIPVLWWRSVGHSGNSFVIESMMDMAAAAAGRDPLEFRLEYLEGDDPLQQRMAATLRQVAEKAGWQPGQATAGQGRGIAMHHSFGSYVAQVADVSRAEDGTITIDRVSCAVDCGIAVNPNVIMAQIEGGIGYGIGHAMRDAITFGEGGVVEQSNFPTYQPLRLGDIGAIETFIVASSEAPTGIGEPGLPPSIPALANAIVAAGGPRIMALPMNAHGVTFKS